MEDFAMNDATGIVASVLYTLAGLAFLGILMWAGEVR